MNKLAVVRIAPRREIKLAPASRTALTCRWVQDPRTGRLVCDWVTQDSIHDEKPGPKLRMAAKAARRSIGRRRPSSVSVRLSLMHCASVVSQTRSSKPRTAPSLTRRHLPSPCGGASRKRSYR
jgi:hypothetical protein